MFTFDPPENLLVDQKTCWWSIGKLGNVLENTFYHKIFLETIKIKVELLFFPTKINNLEAIFFGWAWSDIASHAKAFLLKLQV